MRGCHHLTKWISENFWTEIQKLFVKNMFALSWNNACLIHRQSLHICYSLSPSEQLTCWWPSPLFQLSLMSSGEGGREPTAQGVEHRKDPGRSPGAERKSLLPRAFACSCFFASWQLVEETKSFLFCGKGKHSIFWKPQIFTSHHFHSLKCHVFNNSKYRSLFFKGSAPTQKLWRDNLPLK